MAGGWPSRPTRGAIVKKDEAILSALVRWRGELIAAEVVPLCVHNDNQVSRSCRLDKLPLQVLHPDQAVAIVRILQPILHFSTVVDDLKVGSSGGPCDGRCDVARCIDRAGRREDRAMGAECSLRSPSRSPACRQHALNGQQDGNH